jgi:hypothetical protein
MVDGVPSAFGIYALGVAIEDFTRWCRQRPRWVKIRIGQGFPRFGCISPSRTT